VGASGGGVRGVRCRRGRLVFSCCSFGSVPPPHATSPTHRAAAAAALKGGHPPRAARRQRRASAPPKRPRGASTCAPLPPLQPQSSIIPVQLLEVLLGLLEAGTGADKGCYWGSRRRSGQGRPQSH